MAHLRGQPAMGGILVPRKPQAPGRWAWAGPGLSSQLGSPLESRPGAGSNGGRGPPCLSRAPGTSGAAAQHRHVWGPSGEGRRPGHSQAAWSEACPKAPRGPGKRQCGPWGPGGTPRVPSTPRPCHWAGPEDAGVGWKVGSSQCLGQLRACPTPSRLARGVMVPLSDFPGRPQGSPVAEPVLSLDSGPASPRPHHLTASYSFLFRVRFPGACPPSGPRVTRDLCVPGFPALCFPCAYLPRRPATRAGRLPHQPPAPPEGLSMGSRWFGLSRPRPLGRVSPPLPSRAWRFSVASRTSPCGASSCAGERVPPERVPSSQQLPGTAPCWLRSRDTEPL